LRKLLRKFPKVIWAISFYTADRPMVDIAADGQKTFFTLKNKMAAAEIFDYQDESFEMSR
jgi:hypothetical protein